MYLKFYGLRDRPFNITPDPRYLYLNATYQEALAGLRYGISGRKGFIVLAGEAGTGKTTLLRCLLEELGESTRSVVVFNPSVSFDEMLRYILDELEITVSQGADRLTMLAALNGFLVEELRRGGNVVLFVDEAQDLDLGVLEQLRLLSNLETSREKILQIVLIGQPELEDLLDDPSLRQLRQRIALRCRLKPLDRRDIGAYVATRLATARGQPDRAGNERLFTSAALRAVRRYSRGIPRLINVLCDGALVLGYATEARRIRARLIDEAWRDLHEPVERAPRRRPRSRSWRWTVPAIAGAMALGLGIGGWRSQALPWRGWMSSSLLAARAAPGEERVGENAPAGSAPTPDGNIGNSSPSAVDVGDLPGLRVPESQEDRIGDRASPADSLAPRSEEDRVVLAVEEGIRPEVEVDGYASVSATALVPPARSPRVQQATGDLPAVPTPSEVEGEPAAAAMPEPQEQQEQEHDQTRRAGPDSERVLAGRLPAAGEVEQGPLFGQRVMIRRGDTLSAIAIEQYGLVNTTILDLLKQRNAGIWDVDLIGAGETLVVPSLAAEALVRPEDDGSFTAFLFSVGRRREAEQAARRLARGGMRVSVEEGTLGPGRRVFRVLATGYETAAAAAQAVKRYSPLLAGG